MHYVHIAWLKDMSLHIKKIVQVVVQQKYIPVSVVKNVDM